MTPAEAAQLLTVAAVYDNRKPSAAVAQAWAADLDGVEVAEAASAIREHYRANPGVWVMPGHVVAIVAQHRRETVRGLWLAELRALRSVDPDDPDAVQAALRRARLAAGRQEPERLALLPGKFRDNPSQAERNARGKETVLAELRRRAQNSGEGSS